MVRNRSNGGTLAKWLSEKVVGAVLLASAVMIWLIIIIAITFLMIDNGRLRDTLRGHSHDDTNNSMLHESINADITKIKTQLENLETRIKNNDRRLRSLEKPVDQP